MAAYPRIFAGSIRRKSSSDAPRQAREATAAAMILHAGGPPAGVPAVASRKGNVASVASAPSIPAFVRDVRDGIEVFNDGGPLGHAVTGQRQNAGQVSYPRRFKAEVPPCFLRRGSFFQIRESGNPSYSQCWFFRKIVEESPIDPVHRQPVGPLQRRGCRLAGGRCQDTSSARTSRTARPSSTML